MFQPRQCTVATRAGAFLTTISLLSQVMVATAASDVWDGNGGSPPNGLWGADINWVDDTTPGNSDTATFNLANTYNVTFDTIPAAIQAFSTSAGNVTLASSGGAQTLAVNSGGGQDVTVNGGATLSLGTSGNPLHLTVGDDLIVNGNGTLNVNFGSQVNTSDLTVQASSGNATIVVDGAGSALNRTGTGQRGFGNSTGTVSLTYRNNATGDHNDTLVVGNISDVTGTANLNVESGADLTLDSLTVGINTAPGPTGAMTVTGIGSTITQSGASSLTIGRATGNTGILNVNSSGVFTTGTGPIALNTTGRINISGGALNANGALTMASGGILSIGSGGTLNVNAGIDNSAGGTFNFVSGELVVIGGTVTSAGAFTVGSGGGGTLNIAEQGVVHVGTALTINSTSNVNLNGGTLRFNTISGLNRLNYNSGTIQLAGDRNADTDPTILSLFPGFDIVGFESLKVEGAAFIGFRQIYGGGRLSCGLLEVSNQVGSFNLGGFMSVNSGGQVTSNSARIGASGPTPNSGIVTGDGSSWTNTGELVVGLSDADSVLKVENQGFLSTGSISIYDRGAVYVNGGTLRLNALLRSPGSEFHFQSGTLRLMGNRDIGATNVDDLFDDLTVAVQDIFGVAPVITSQRNLTVEGSATLLNPVTIDGGTFSVGKLVNGHHLHFQRGTLNITNQVLTIGATGAFGDTLDLANNMAVNVTLGTTNQGFVSGDGEIGGTFANAAAGELRADPGKSLTLTGSGNTNAGRIRLLGGALDFDADLTNNAGAFISGNGSLITGGLTNNGTMNFAGTANIIGDVTNASSGKIISGGGGATIFYDDVVNNGEIRTSTNGFTVFFGSVSGAGSFTGTGTVNFEGDISPGNSPAAVSFAGDVVLGPEAILTIEIGGANAGSQYDQINVAGELTLEGALELVLINGFVPSAGQVFDFLNWGSVAGAFSSIELPALPGLAWNTDQLAAGVLSVVLPGDYNFDGTVDAADYVVWRKRNGSQTEYNTWRSNYGKPPGSGSSSAAGIQAAVPEPASAWLLLVGTVVATWRGCRRAAHVPSS